jgi:hypothetical protein
MKNTEYRDCFKTDTETECVFASFNEYGNHCCTIDKVVCVRWFGCRPQEIINKVSKKLEDEMGDYYE